MKDCTICFERRLSHRCRRQGSRAERADNRPLLAHSLSRHVPVLNVTGIGWSLVLIQLMERPNTALLQPCR